MSYEQSKTSRRRRQALPSEKVTGQMLSEILGPYDRRYKISAPGLTAEDVVVHGHLSSYDGHSGLRVHATNTLEAHDLNIAIDSEPKFSVAIFLEGDLDLIIDTHRVTLGGGDTPSGHIWTLTKPTTFRRESKKGTHVRKVVISVPPEWILGTLRETPANINQLEEFILTHGANFHWAPSSRAQALAAQIINPSEATDIVRQINVESNAMEIVAEAIATFVGSVSSTTDKKPSIRNQTRAERIRAFVMENINEELSLAHIAKELGISVPSMQRAFKTAYGSTVIDFIREVRLHTARATIEKEGITVSEAAYRAGYTNPANFSTAFRKLFGITPSQVRG